jgi:ATP-dependent DNA helicase RecG
MNLIQLQRLLTGLQSLPNEKEWVEFKENRADPEDIGEYISALSNTARLKGESYGYVVWGVRDQTHELVGTNFAPEAEAAKKGNEQLEHWLVRLLTPRLDLRFCSFVVEGKSIVILEIPATLHTPVQFQGTEFIRVGSLKKKLKEYLEKERELWQVLNNSKFEEEISKFGLDGNEVLSLLDYTKYFEMTDQSLPQNKDGILSKLQTDNLITKALEGWSITNLGAILFAKNLDDFNRLSRKALRIIQY